MTDHIKCEHCGIVLVSVLGRGAEFALALHRQMTPTCEGSK